MVCLYVSSAMDLRSQASEIQQNPSPNSNTIPYPVHLYTVPQLVQLPTGNQQPISLVLYAPAHIRFSNQTNGEANGGAAVVFQEDSSAGRAASGQSEPNPLHVATDVPAAPNTVERDLKAKNKKPLQFVTCEICQVTCNNKAAFDEHASGRKHLKNLGKLKVPNTTTPPSSSAIVAPVVSEPTPAPTLSEKTIGPVNNPIDLTLSSSAKRKQKRKAAEIEDLETKRKKMVQFGTLAENVRVCVPCNVICNSQKAFDTHVVGSKHSAMTKKNATDMA